MVNGQVVLLDFVGLRFGGADANVRQGFEFAAALPGETDDGHPLGLRNTRSAQEIF